MYKIDSGRSVRVSASFHIFALIAGGNVLGEEGNCPGGGNVRGEYARGGCPTYNCCHRNKHSSKYGLPKTSTSPAIAEAR